MVDIVTKYRWSAAQPGEDWLGVKAKPVGLAQFCVGGWREVPVAMLCVAAPVHSAAGHPSLEMGNSDTAAE